VPTTGVRRNWMYLAQPLTDTNLPCYSKAWQASAAAELLSHAPLRTQTLQSHLICRIISRLVRKSRSSSAGMAWRGGAVSGKPAGQPSAGACRTRVKTTAPADELIS